MDDQADISEITALGSLHDLALVGIRLGWQEAVASLELSDHDGAAVTLLMHGLKRFELARELEWGPSVYVNDATVERLPAGAVRLTIEMQTGDSIAILGSRLERQGPRTDEPDPSALPLG